MDTLILSIDRERSLASSGEVLWTDSERPRDSEGDVLSTESARSLVSRGVVLSTDNDRPLKRAAEGVLTASLACNPSREMEWGLADFMMASTEPTMAVNDGPSERCHGDSKSAAQDCDQGMRRCSWALRVRHYLQV